MKFEWDEKKNKANIKKHGINFTHAIDAFLDPMCREYYDYKHSGEEEDRMMIVGIAKGVFLIVSFTEPDDETKRIISARKATKHELEVLYGNG